MKNRWHRYNINRPRSRHGHKYSKYKKYLIMMMLICTKQHVSNTWSSIHEKVKQHWGWVEKKASLIKKSVYLTSIVSFFIDQSEKWIVSSFYNLIVKLPKNEKLKTWHCSLDFWRILSCKIPKYAHMSNQHSILFDGLVRLNYDYMELIIAWWKPVDSLTGLVRFHVIRNLPVNEIYQFPGWPFKRAVPFTVPSLSI